MIVANISHREAPSFQGSVSIIKPMRGPRGNRYATHRGVYRVFNTAAYRFYRSTIAPPVEGSVPFATSATLPYTPTATFADGTWYLSVSYFDGVLDSGFLPVGANGQTYLTMEISGGQLMATRPGQPQGANLVQLAAGVVQVNAFYARATDGTNAATTWAINYTTDGSTPASNAPIATKPIGTAPLNFLSFKLPAQINGTTVKVQLQTVRGSGGAAVYSLPLPVLSIVVNTTGPTAPLGVASWPGSLPEDL